MKAARPRRERPRPSSENESRSVCFRRLRGSGLFTTRYAARMIPWIIFALVAVPLVVIGFVATRRRTAAGEHPASEDARSRALTEQEFAKAEAYEAKWHEEDKERYRQERLP
jgi:hypothetical protein